MDYCVHAMEHSIRLLSTVSMAELYIFYSYWVISHMDLGCKNLSKFEGVA